MTGGAVVVLGEVGLNFGAGMSGGVGWVLDPTGELPLRLNAELVAAERAADAELQELIERHVRHTGSPRAAALLARWREAGTLFWRVSPRAEAQTAPVSERIAAADRA